MNNTPFLTDTEIKILNSSLEENLNHFPKSEVFRCLEWGSGGSSVYYVNWFVSKNDVNFEWHSIEHNPSWYNEVKQSVVDSRFHIHLFDYGKYPRCRVRNICMKEYVEFPRSLGFKFDFIFVDGRKRSRCLRESLLLLNKNGILFLDNADRPYYKESMSLFPKGHMISEKAWMVKND